MLAFHRPRVGPCFARVAGCGRRWRRGATQASSAERGRAVGTATTDGSDDGRDDEAQDEKDDRCRSQDGGTCIVRWDRFGAIGLP